MRRSQGIGRAWLIFAVVLVVFVVLYVIFHAYQYSGCGSRPDLTEWPPSCHP